MPRWTLPLGIALGALVGFALGRGTAPPAEAVATPAREAPARAAERPRPAVRPTVAPSSGATCADDLALALETIAELEVELHGRPVPWTDDVPADYRPEAVEPRIRQALADCGVDADLVGFDCEEPPCFAILDTTGAKDARDRLVNECPTWREAWDERTSETSRGVVCPDGTRRQLLMIGPAPPPTAAPPKKPEDQRADLENRMKRHHARGKSAEERLCAVAAKAR